MKEKKEDRQEGTEEKVGAEKRAKWIKVRQSEEKWEFCRTSVLHLDVSRSSARARPVCVALKQRHIFKQH